MITEIDIKDLISLLKSKLELANLCFVKPCGGKLVVEIAHKMAKEVSEELKNHEGFLKSTGEVVFSAQRGYHITGLEFYGEEK